MKYFQTDDIKPQNLDEISELIITEKNLLNSNPWIQELKDTNIVLLSTAISDKHKYEAAYKYTCELRSRIIESIRAWQLVNNGIDFNLRQWGYIFNSYLMQIIYTFYAKYLKIQSMDFREISFNIQNQNVLPVIEHDGATGSLYYHAYLYGILLEHFGANNLGGAIDSKPNSESFAIDYFSKQARARIKQLFNRKVALRNRIGAIHGYLTIFRPFPPKINTHSIITRTFLPRALEKKIARESNGEITYLENMHFYYYDYKFAKIVTPNKKSRREMLSEFNPQNEFEELLTKAIVDTMPLSFCENFMTTYNNFIKITKNYSAKKIYSAARHDPVFSAIMDKKGAKIIDIQHSGVYGSFLASGVIEYATYDEFLTWGWSEKVEGCVIRPVAPTRVMSRKKQKINDSIKRILLVTNETIQWENISDMYHEDAIDRHIRFIEEISTELKCLITLRVRYDFNNLADVYKEKYPDIRVERASEILLTDSIDKSDIIIVDNYSSPFYESLLSGKPTYLYGAIEPMTLSDTLRSWLDKMSAAGIYYNDGKDLAYKFNASYLNEYEKWKRGEYDGLINDFLKYYLSIGKDYEKEWIKEFSS